MPTQTITNNPPRSEQVSFGATLIVGGAISGGVTQSITQHGHCWALTANPTTADSKTENGTSGGGAFTSAITGLASGTLYHTRAYAVNSSGTAYGSDVEFTTHRFIPSVFIF